MRRFKSKRIKPRISYRTACLCYIGWRPRTTHWQPTTFNPREVKKIGSSAGWGITSRGELYWLESGWCSPICTRTHVRYYNDIRCYMERYWYGLWACSSRVCIQHTVNAHSIHDRRIRIGAERKYRNSSIELHQNTSKMRNIMWDRTSNTSYSAAVCSINLLSHLLVCRLALIAVPTMDQNLCQTLSMTNVTHRLPK